MAAVGFQNGFRTWVSDLDLGLSFCAVGSTGAHIAERDIIRTVCIELRIWATRNISFTYA